MSMKNSNDTIGNRTRDLNQLRHRVPPLHGHRPDNLKFLVLEKIFSAGLRVKKKTEVRDSIPELLQCGVCASDF
jgi:hypothetical protein